MGDVGGGEGRGEGGGGAGIKVSNMKRAENIRRKHIQVGIK